MENRPGKAFGLHDVVYLLKEEKEIISKKMGEYDLENPDQSRFVVLLKRKEAFEEVINIFQDLIEPEGGGRMIGQYTRESAAGPEPNRFKGGKMNLPPSKTSE